MNTVDAQVGVAMTKTLNLVEQSEVLQRFYFPDVCTLTTCAKLFFGKFYHLILLEAASKVKQLTQNPLPYSSIQGFVYIKSPYVSNYNGS